VAKPAPFEIDLAALAAIVAGNRFGKTHAGVVDNLIQTLPLEFLPPWLHRFKRWGIDEPFYCRVVVVDLPNALTKVMLPKVRSLVPPAALMGGKWEKAYNDRNRMLQFADGSWWDFLTHDMNVDAYAGAALHRVHFDEEPPGEKGRCSSTSPRRACRTTTARSASRSPRCSGSTGSTTS
jgi:hypothetical protein